MSHSTIEAAVLREIRLDKAATRVQLARRLEIAPSTIGIHVDRLVEQGFLREMTQSESGLGRPPKILEPNPAAGQFIGIDLDARRLHGVSVDFSQQLLRERSTDIPLRASADDVLAQILEVIRSLRDRRRKLLGIGLAIPGTLNAAADTALHYRFIRGWSQIPLLRIVHSAFPVPVYVENNMRVMALAERWFGQARAMETVICVGIRSGIGAGIILNGELFRGPNGLAGEIGTWPVTVASSGQASGQTVPLEDLASLRSLQQRLRHAQRKGIKTSLHSTRREVFISSLKLAAVDQDPLALQVLRDAATAVGRAISQISLLLNPQMIIVGGPLADFEESFMTPLREEASVCLLPQHAIMPDIVSTSLGELAGAKGAAALALHRWQP